MDKEKMKEYAKSVKSSSYPYYNFRSVPVLIHQPSPGLETIVFEGIEGAGLLHTHKRLEEVFKSKLDIDLPLYKKSSIDQTRRAMMLMGPLCEQASSYNSDFEHLELIVNVRQEGCSVKEASAVAEVLLTAYQNISMNIETDITYNNIDLVSKAYPYKKPEDYVKEPDSYENPGFKHVSIHRSPISAYLYGLVALIGKNEIKKLLDKYYDYDAGDDCKWNTKNLTPMAYTENEDDEEETWTQPMEYKLLHPEFLYDLVHLPKVQEYTLRWALFMSRFKTNSLTLHQGMSFKEIDHLVYVNTYPEVAYERLKRTKGEDLTYVEELEGLRFLYLMYNALFTCVFFKGHGDEHLASLTDYLYDSIQGQFYRVLEETTIKGKDDDHSYDYALFDWINILKDMFNVRNMRTYLLDNTVDGEFDNNYTRLFESINQNGTEGYCLRRSKL